MSRLAFVALTVALMAAPVAPAASDEAWAALAKGGHVALVRHGNAPPGYGGDPPVFKIDDCATQRNMDERGRAQARAVGEAFRQHGVIVDKILSSPWCRCLERILDRKSTRLNSSHSQISYAVFCLQKKRTSQYTP